MKRLLLFSISISLLLLASCNKGLPVDTVYERIIGTWKVDEVKFNPPGTLPSRDLTTKFQYHKYIFNADYTMTFVDAETEESYDGYFYIDEKVTYDKDNNKEVEQYIEIALYNPDIGLTKNFTWTLQSISSKKLKVTEKRNGGKYKVTFVK